MWVKTLDGDLVNLDHVVRVGRMGGDGAVCLYVMGDDGLYSAGGIGEVMWLRLLKEYDMDLGRGIEHHRVLGTKVKDKP